MFLPDYKCTKIGNFCVEGKLEMSGACNSFRIRVGAEEFLLMTDIV